MEIAAFIVSVLAAIFTGLAVWFTRGEKKAAEAAASEAKRSADAAQEATGYQRAEVERNRVRFVLEPGDKNVYWLRNRGTDSAYRVHVDTTATDMRIIGGSDYDDFPDGHAEKYVFLRVAGTETDHLPITWYMTPDGKDKQRGARLPIV